MGQIRVHVLGDETLPKFKVIVELAKKVFDPFFVSSSNGNFPRSLYNNPLVLVVALTSNGTSFLEDSTFKGHCISERSLKLKNTFQTFELKGIIADLTSIFIDFKNEYLRKIEYVPVSPKKLLTMKQIHFDIYVRINDKKFVKVYDCETPNLELIKKYSDKDTVDSFYLTKYDFYSFFEDVYSYEVDFVSELDNLKEVEKSVSSFHKGITALGIGSHHIERVQNLAKSVIEKNKNNKELVNLINSFNLLEGSFLYNHSFFLSLFLTKLVTNFEWNNYVLQEKLILASILHDMGVSGKSAKSFSFSNEYLLHDSFDSKHEEKIAKMLTNLKGVEADVVKMVSKHHFSEPEINSREFMSKVSLPHACFVLCHDFSVELFRKAFRLDKIESILDDMSSIYSTKPFTSVFPTFKETVYSTFNLE